MSCIKVAGRVTMLTFIGHQLHRYLILLDGSLQNTGVVHDRHLAVQCGLAGKRALVFHHNAQLSIGPHPGSLTLHLHLHTHVLCHGSGVNIWLAAIATGCLHSDAFFIWTWIEKTAFKMSKWKRSHLKEVSETSVQAVKFSLPSWCLYRCVMSARSSEPTALVLIQWPTAFFSVYTWLKVPSKFLCQ